MPKDNCSKRIKEALEFRNMKQAELCKRTNIPKSAMSQYLSGKFEPKQDRVFLIAQALNVSEAWLMGYDVPINNENKLKFPKTTTETTTFPVIGEIAAGYEHLAYEDWSGDTIEIPTSYLKGRPKNDYFVLEVKGDSMYPQYQECDKVLILKQSTLNRSGEIGAIIYDGECATLKKIEFVKGEDWLEMIPLNPEYKPRKIEGSDLEECRIIGIPKLIIREVE